MKTVKKIVIGLLRFSDHYQDKFTGNTFRRWHNFFKQLRSFEIHINQKLMSNSFDKQMLDRFYSFLITERDYKQGTIWSFFNNLRSLLKAAEKAGYGISDDLQSYRVKNSGETIKIFLTNEELAKLINYELHGPFEVARDRFIIGCYTALRFSDFSVISENNIKNEFLHVTTLKTATPVIVPLHPVVKKILEKYNYNLPPVTSSQWVNKVIKSIGKLACIDDPVLLEKKKNGVIEKIQVPKWQLISTHTARRTAATNMYLAGIPVFRIMLITGHKTEESFFKYICIGKEENAQALSTSSFFLK